MKGSQKGRERGTHGDDQKNIKTSFRGTNLASDSLSSLLDHVFFPLLFYSLSHSVSNLRCFTSSFGRRQGYLLVGSVSKVSKMMMILANCSLLFCYLRNGKRQREQKEERTRELESRVEHLLHQLLFIRERNLIKRERERERERERRKTVNKRKMLKKEEEEGGRG